jgi:adenylosuccinate synthase
MTDMLDYDRLESRLRTIATGFQKRYGKLLEYDVEEELSRLKVRLGIICFSID